MSIHHAIDYIELPAPDLAAAKAFYGSALGWTFTDYGEAYVGFSSTGGDEDGGFDPRGTPHAGGPLVQVYSDDLEATLRAVVAAGGAISVEPFAFPGGRRFQFTDPAGNELGAWSRT
ncbi:VOC family protein [Nocardioides sp. R-C-SC26]|uniref:VOC family protein n=1 Tax=Nocardioides sp. R-C-SC26 TaxID=2870414 RepID=UPI001E3F19FE|nr:VOC family protein [Nocardioides sp. R-C-SC26]